MVKKSKKKASRRRKNDENVLEQSFWLLLSVAGGILFSFGLLNYIDERGWSAGVSVIVGAIITIFALAVRKYRTETSVALNRSKR